MNIYFSALPFAPQNTTLYRVYAARYRDTPRVALGYLESWPEELCTVRNLGGDEISPRHLAFSADSSRLALATSTHLVTASPLTGIQLGGKYRLGSSDAELPIALACRPAYLASITSGLVLRTVDARSLKEVQLSLPPTTSSLIPEVSCAAFNQSVNTLFVGFRDGRVHVWRLRRYSWEPDRDSHPQSHSSVVHCVATSMELFASASQRELKIGPFVDLKSADVARETLALTPRCLAEARDAADGDWSVRISFSATSAMAWACVVSLHHISPASHSIHVFTSDDQRGRKVFATASVSHPVYSLSHDASVLTVICDDLLLRWSTAQRNLLERRALIGVDRARPDRFPLISPDGHLLALCDEEVVHIRDLIQPPPRRPENNAGIKAAGVILAEVCYIVRAGKGHWLARVRDDGVSEDIVQLGEHEIERLAVSADGSKLASLSFYQGKTRHGLLEIADLKSKRRAATTTWPMALHDSFTDWDVCHMEFSATRKHVAVVFFLRAIESSYICACDLETGALRWKELPGKLRPLAARSLWGEELIVVRPRDLWKVDLETMASSSRHELYSRDSYRMATCYARFTDTTDGSSSSSSPLEMASRLWNKPPWHTVWNPETVTREEAAAAAEIKRTAAYLEVHDKNAFGYWVLDNMGQRICCIPEEHCSGWGRKTLSSIGHNRFALVNEDTHVMIVVNFKPMME
jgi:WD40 repeat protein